MKTCVVLQPPGHAFQIVMWQEEAPLGPKECTPPGKAGPHQAKWHLVACLSGQRPEGKQHELEKVPAHILTVAAKSSCIGGSHFQLITNIQI